MLKRKIEDTLTQWKNTPNHKPLVIMGIRQCGKTFIAQHFAEANYKTVVYINFIKQPERISAFVGSKAVDDILLSLSAQIAGVTFTPGKTCFIFDEIQECPEARTSLKFFKEDGRFDVIATGSLLGVQGYGDEKKKRRRKLVQQKDLGINSVPVGSEDIVEMYPLDFEEFLWANNISNEVIEALKKFYNEETPVPAGIHSALKQLLNLYIAIGGLPEAVNAFLSSNNMNEVSKFTGPDRGFLSFFQLMKNIAKMVKLKTNNNKENNNYFIEYFIIDKDNVFKVYVTDIGLLIEMLGASTRADILQGNLGGFKGAIYENLMADTLHKKAQSLYYFQKDSGLELDFLVRMDGECVPLEVKAKSSKAKSAKTVLAHPEKYQVKRIIKFGDYNIGREGGLLTLPTYMQFLLDLEPEEIVLIPIDTDELNQLAKQVLDNNEI